MPWLDITRNLDTGNRERVVDLFTFNKLLYAVAKTYDLASGPSNLVHSVDPGTYKIYEHLGADPPVIDTIWGAPTAFPIFSVSQEYIPAGKAEDTSKGFIYLGDAAEGTVYVNTTPNLIDGNWTSLRGPFGLDEFSGTGAELRDITFYNNKLFAAHKGGVSAHNVESGLWELVGLFAASPNSFGQVTSLLGFAGELYVTVSYGDIGKIHKYNVNVSKPEEWILVGDFPLDSPTPTQLVEYQNNLFAIIADPDKNVFDISKIDTTLTSTARFFAGTHLSGVPTSIIKYRKDGNLWATCVREEFSRRGYLKGDVNADGKVDWNDVTALTGHLFGGGHSDFISTAASDVSFSNDLTIGDLTRLISYLSEQVTDLPGETPVFIDTIGPNLITDLNLNLLDLNQTQSFRIDLNKLIDVQSGIFWEGSAAIPNDSRRFHLRSDSLHQAWRWPDEVSGIATLSGAGGGETNLDSTGLLSQVNVLSTLLAGPVVSRENINFKVTGDLWIDKRILEMGDNFTKNDSSAYVRTTLMRLRAGLAERRTQDFPERLNWLYKSNPAIAPPTEMILPWFDNAESDFPDPNSSPIIPLDFTGYFIRQWLYEFNPSTIGVLHSMVDVYFRFDLEIANPDVGFGHPRIGHEYHKSTSAPGGGGERHYRPSISLRNVSNRSFGILPDVTYIAKTRADIPSGFEEQHVIVEPSGPDQWFIKFEKIINGEGAVVSPGGIPENFNGVIQSRLVTNGVDLIAGESYELNLVVNLHSSPVGNILFKVGTSPRQISGQNVLILFYHLLLPTEVTQNFITHHPITVPFTVPSSFAAHPDVLKNTQFFIEFEERQYAQSTPAPDTNGLLTSYGIDISDVNIVRTITGSTINSIHQYNGMSWNSVRASIVDPNTETDIPRKGLVDNFDLRSDEYQLYSHGGGRAWVWHYDGGLYSGSAGGIRLERRPQIVNIL